MDAGALPYMLFLVIGHPKEGRVLPSKREFLELVVKEWETVIAHRETGQVVEVYGFDDGTGGIVVFDVESREELDSLLNELPLDPYADWDVLPLIEADVGLEKAKKKLAELQERME